MMMTGRTVHFCTNLVRTLARGKHQDPWGQSSRHRRLNIQTSTSNARSPFRRKMVSPFDPTDLGALQAGEQAQEISEA